VERAPYDGLAEWYDRTVMRAGGAWQQSGEELVGALLPDGPGRLLDVGCGGGAFMPAVATKGWSIVGVGVSADQLGVARRRGVKPAPRLVRADATALPLGSTAFRVTTTAAGTPAGRASGVTASGRGSAARSTRPSAAS
jgi:ubiquinone/menaquinone biosynthesis C-methylase UbiE